MVAQIFGSRSRVNKKRGEKKKENEGEKGRKENRERIEIRERGMRGKRAEAERDG